MKTIAIVFLLLLCPGISQVYGQNMGIQSVYMSPPNPTDQDIIYLLTELKISTSGCWKTDQTTAINPLYIYNKSNYCSGNYAAVCSTTDTITLQPLEAGNYIYHYVVDIASYIDDCEESEPYDSIDVAFTVINSTSIANSFDNRPKINLYYSKLDKALNIMTIEDIGTYTLYINSIEGKELKKIKSKSSKLKVDLDIKTGVYLITIVGDGIFETRKIFVSN